MTTHAHDRVQTHSPLRAHGHSHGLVHDSLKRSRAGLRAVALALLVLGLTALAQAAVFVASDSVALLADLIHNAGDAATAIPLGAAFALHSARAERWAGLAVVFAICVSACVAGYEAIDRLIHPQQVDQLGALAADGEHARMDAYVSLAVVASAAAVAAGVDILDPLIGLAITVVILRITW